MVEHWFNGEHDVAAFQCKSLSSQKDVWSVVHKETQITGEITIIHSEEGQYEGFDWDQPILLNKDGTPTESLQEMLDCLSEAYQ
jgi:hypothetical protein